jgi:hypothetical protein
VSSSSRHTSRTIVERDQQGRHQSDRCVRLSEDLINDVLRVFATISETLAVGSYDDEGDVSSRVAISGVEKRAPWYLSSLVGRFENQSSFTLAHHMQQCRLSKRRLEVATSISVISRDTHFDEPRILNGADSPRCSLHELTLGCTAIVTNTKLSTEVGRAAVLSPATAKTARYPRVLFDISPCHPEIGAQRSGCRCRTSTIVVVNHTISAKVWRRLWPSHLRNAESSDL